MAKVKYIGSEAIRLHKIDFYPGDVKIVADGLVLPKDLFEVVGVEKEEKKKKPSKKEE